MRTLERTCTWTRRQAEVMVWFAFCGMLCTGVTGCGVDSQSLFNEAVNATPQTESYLETISESRALCTQARLNSRVSTVIDPEHIDFNNGCYPKMLDWQPVADTCDNCGLIDNTMGVIQISIPDATLKCPEHLYEGLDETDRRYFEDKQYITEYGSSYALHCAVPQLPTPLSCADAEQIIDHDTSGWYYCEDESDTTNCDDPYRIRVTERLWTVVEEGLEVFSSMVNTTDTVMFDIRSLPMTTLDDEACDETGPSVLGSECIQPNHEVSPSAITHYEISFQQNCDCMTTVEVRPDLESQQAISHFCTQPCTDGCPDGFVCTDIIDPILDLPDGFSRAYCVPSCIAEPCGTNERCVLDDTDTEGLISWRCEAAK